MVSSKHDINKQIGRLLAQRFLEDPKNQELRDELVVYCQETITKIVRYLVVARGYHPSHEDRHAFVEDACQDVVVKVLENIESLDSSDNLFAWIRTIAFNLLVTAYRDAVGRGKTPRTFADSLVKAKDGTCSDIFDAAEGRDAAMQHLARSLTDSVDAEHWTERIHDRALLDKALSMHVHSGKKRDFESGCWVKETWDYHATPEQIAQLRCRSVGDTQHLLHHDNAEIMLITKKLLGL